MPVDTAYTSKSYTTEAQRIKDAQYAQAEAVIKSGQMVDVNSIAVQQVDSDNKLLLDTYGKHVDAAAVDSSSAAATTVTSSPTANAQAAATKAQALSSDDTSSSPDGAHLFGLKSDVHEIAQKAADGIADLKDSIVGKFHGSQSPAVDAATAAVAGHSQLYQAGAHTAAVSSSDAIGGKSLPSIPLNCITTLTFEVACTPCVCLQLKQPHLMNASSTASLGIPSGGTALQAQPIGFSHTVMSVQDAQHGPLQAIDAGHMLQPRVKVAS